MKAGAWNKASGHALSESTLGIIGVGNIGKAVARRARSFGMRVLGNDIVEVDHVFVSEAGIEMTDLHTLFSQSDYVSLNCDLNPTSHHLLGAEALAFMKKDGIVINTARGPIVDEPELIRALQASRIGGAALDVFETEPLPQDSPLRGMGNVMLDVTVRETATGYEESTSELLTVSSTSLNSEIELLPRLFLPEMDTFLELTTMRQALVTKKNKKIRLFREKYPDLKLLIFYGRDFRKLAQKYGLE